jgi:pre-mRNA-processing factor SLU7
LDYEGKHDRWNGYDPATFAHVIEEWEALEAERKE